MTLRMTLRMQLRIPQAALVLTSFAAAAFAGCADPVHDDAVALLGPEDPNVPVGPLHRAGQPCLVCHDGGGPASLVFGTAGTIFQDGVNVFPNAVPMAGATVTMTDPNGLVTQVETNCAGNFYVEQADWAAAGVAFPMHVGVSWRSVSTTMISHMGKETSCAQCHIYVVPGTNGDPPTAGMDGPANVSQIYLNFDVLSPPPPSCQ
jgi:hypothetical protein